MANPLLQQSEDGHSFIMPDGDSAAASGRPSLEGSSGLQAGKAKGIGGTLVSAERPLGGPERSPAASMAHGQSGSHAPEMTPAQMMIMADQMEQDMLAKTHAAENPYGSSLESHIDRGNSVQGNVPDWLHDYMSKQPFTDPYHQAPMSGLDAVKQNKYLTEQERLKYMRSLRK